MKKFAICITVAMLLLTFGCSSNESTSESASNQQNEDNSIMTTDEQDKQEKVITDNNQIRKIFEVYALTEEDKLTELSIKNNEIKAVIELGESELPPKEIALSVYSSAADELLMYEGWEVLTVEFKDVGIISMDKSFKEINEYGPYFPYEDIENNLVEYNN